MDNSARPRLLTRVALLVLTLGGLLAPLVVLTPGPSYAASHQPAADGSGRVVRVGTEGTYPPFSYRDPRTQQLTGYDLEVVKAVAKEAGWRLKFVTSTFDAIFPALDSGRIDVVANQVTINPERKARYAFSTPYTFSRGVIVVAKDSKGISSLADLKGRTT
ncbi:MAG: transporter substrate-binding protein, partial [Marmoricola sp.]|nr:transporter substrate-binding protein [Marmoricola sp.]